MSQPRFMLPFTQESLFILRFRNIFPFHCQDLHLTETLNSVDWATISQSVFCELVILQDTMESNAHKDTTYHVCLL